MTDMMERLGEAAAAVADKIGDRAPKLGLILGSGLGSFADTLDDPVVVPYRDIPHFPVSSVAGHAGQLVSGKLDGADVLVMQGRVHFYEGYDLETVVFPARALIHSGCKILVITNAAGGIHPNLAEGDLMLLTDHLNLMGHNPLRGPNVDALGTRFPDMTACYDPELRELAEQVARSEDVALRRGVYAALSGPSYETPAEIRMLKAMGADAVGMSTVPEAIAANHAGARVLGMSCVTNLAAGIATQKLSHEEVSETASRVEKTFVRFMRALSVRLAAVAAAE